MPRLDEAKARLEKIPERQTKSFIHGSERVIRRTYQDEKGRRCHTFITFEVGFGEPAEAWADFIANAPDDLREALRQLDVARTALIDMAAGEGGILRAEEALKEMGPL